MANRWVRRTGIAVATLVGILVLAVAGIFAFTTYRFSRTYDIAARPIPAIVSDSATLARGEHLATAIGKCVHCHGADLGGNVFIDDPMLGRVVATNLTSGTGGVLGQYKDDAHIARAIRSGLRHDGRGLFIMPSEEFRFFSDEDVSALIAYIRTRPPVNRELPPTSIRILARVLYTAGQFPLINAESIDPNMAPAAKTPTESPVALGQYLANTGGCTGCHGPGLSGGKIPGVPPDWKPASNLTPAGIGWWKEIDFVRALRQGTRPDGSPIDTIMPWRLAGKMTDEEMHAMWSYLQSIPPKEYGNR